MRGESDTQHDELASSSDPDPMDAHRGSSRRCRCGPCPQPSDVWVACAWTTPIPTRGDRGRYHGVDLVWHAPIRQQVNSRYFFPSKDIIKNEYLNTCTNMYAVVAAVDEAGGIGKDGTIPWVWPEDMSWFRKTTTAAPPGKINAVIMGRHTYESLGSKPLRARINVVVSSRQLGHATCFSDFEQALSYIRGLNNVHHVFAIGGRGIYEAALRHPAFTTTLLSRVGGDHQCDVKFPMELLAGWSLGPSIDTSHPVETYINADAVATDRAYLELVARLLNSTAPPRPNRTGIPTLSTFGEMIKVPLRVGGHATVPLLTTKFVPLKAVWVELLWFLSGEGNIDLLTAHGVKIWDGNSTREFLDARGLHDYRPGEVGPAYGWQWRHFGAKYLAEKLRPPGWKPEGGVDQIARIIEGIKRDPHDRRHVLSAWNPCDIDAVALPPCHMSAQWWVENGDLHCLMNMRSCDVALGLPFNIASYSLLTHVIAKLTGYSGASLTIVTGDTHIYTNHVEGLREQLSRTPRGSPRLTWARDFTSVDDLTPGTIVVTGYCPHPKIVMGMAV